MKISKKEMIDIVEDFNYVARHRIFDDVHRSYAHKERSQTNLENVIDDLITYIKEI